MDLIPFLNFRGSGYCGADERFTSQLKISSMKTIPTKARSNKSVCKFKIESISESSTQSSSVVGSLLLDVILGWEDEAKKHQHNGES